MKSPLISFIFIALTALLCGAWAGADDEGPGAPVPLRGIHINMKSKNLADSWGVPAKRDYKIGTDVWFYLNENTANPTDGVVVEIKKGRVSGWRLVDNIYTEMEIWGKGAGSYR